MKKKAGTVDGSVLDIWWSILRSIKFTEIRIDNPVPRATTIDENIEPGRLKLERIRFQITCEERGRYDNTLRVRLAPI